MSEQLDQITLKAGTVIHYHGMPFVIPRDTVVEGRQANFDLVEASGTTPMNSADNASPRSDEPNVSPTKEPQ